MRSLINNEVIMRVLLEFASTSENVCSVVSSPHIFCRNLKTVKDPMTVACNWQLQIALVPQASKPVELQLRQANFF
jgi:hypothetical protein